VADPVPEPEPAPEPPPVETAAPAPAKPKPPPEPTCADLKRGRCRVTEGCKWLSTGKCLDEDKPKTLE
jgi:hypothetical protein